MTGDPSRVESYFERYPELCADPDAALNLILAEFRLRWGSEVDLTVEEYVRRFPQYSAQISAHLKLLTRDQGTTHST